MKILTFGFLTMFIFSANTIFAQKSKMKDWSHLFPEIQGCERTFEPLVKNGEIIEQTAVYRPQSVKENEAQIYYGCGVITLRFQPSARKDADLSYSDQGYNPFIRKQKVKTFDAYSESPMCGNDEWRGMLRVYFDEDKVLIVRAKRGVGDIFQFAENADYGLMKKTIDEFIKAKG